MPEAARLVLIADATGLKTGEQGLDSLARKGAKVEKEITLNTKSIELAMARLGGVIGGLDTTMKSLEAAVTKSMGRASQEVTKGARTFDDLRASIDPAFAATQRFNAVQAELNVLLANGKASQDQVNAVLEIARSRYLGVATAAEEAEEAQKASATAVAKATGDYESLSSAIPPGSSSSS